MSEQQRQNAEMMDPVEVGLLGSPEELAAFGACLPEDMAEMARAGLVAVLGAAVQGRSAGVLCYAVAGNTAVLPWLYVLPACRRQYLASTLLGELLDLLQSDAYDFDIEAVTLEYDDSAEGLEAFLTAAGFSRLATGDVALGARLDALAECDFMKRPSRPGDVTLVPLASLSELHLRALSAELLQAGADYTGLPFTEGHFMLGQSFAAYRGNEAVGCVALSSVGERRVLLSCVYVAHSWPAVLMGLLGAAGAAALQALPGDTLLEVPVLSPSARHLAEKLLGPAAIQAGRLVEARLELLAPMPDEA